MSDGVPVGCERLDEDAYGRTIARCHASGQDLAGALVDQGLAWAFVRYSDAYVAREADARAPGIEVWQADAVLAWQYRAVRWSPADEFASADACPIKGNINAKGERIYHMP